MTTFRRSRIRAAAAAAVTLALGCTALAALPGTAGAAAAGGLVVQYRTSASGATADQSEPWLKVRNSGSASVPLSDVKLRYYFKGDSASAAYRFACSWAVKGCANITGTFRTLPNPTATADRYLEIGFTAGAGTLAPGADTGDMQLRFHRADWQPLGQSDDYSFGAERNTYGDWARITAQVGSVTAWGEAPGGNGPTDPTDPPTDPRPTGRGCSTTSATPVTRIPGSRRTAGASARTPAAPGCRAPSGLRRTSPSAARAAVR